MADVTKKNNTSTDETVDDLPDVPSAEEDTQVPDEPDTSSLTENEIAQELSRKVDGDNPLGTIIPERNSVDWNNSRIQN